MKRWWLGALLLMCAGTARALCSVATPTAPTFVLISSVLVRTTVQSTSTLNAGLTCTVSLLTLLGSGDHFYLTVTGSKTGLQVGSSGPVIGYTLYANNTTSYPIARGTQFDFARNSLIDLLGLLGSTNPKSVWLYLQTIIGSNVPTGQYTETLTLAWSWNYCSGIGIGAICLGRDIGSGSMNMVVNLQVTNDCQITAPNLSFGSAPLVLGFATVSNSISVSCTLGSSYTVGLSDGGQPVSAGGRRRMISGSNYLAYDLFKSAGSVRWGSTGSAWRDSSDAEVNPGNGTGTGSQVFNYNAKVYTDQTTPPAGSYLDSVIVDVAF
ncbi:type I pilus protein CsuE [Pseudomonas sp. M47T1]|uniref:Csu type fimbrial protein n=1 Tax=unclassified Pseudomonas TaxID=196821 RepID=UPI0002606789|nr:spore coat U domain-containing protein [Pseudomonas sp. M47T1]EIK96336.1 type I pilus protein CsuE [Pseudomonas sp. M47T1]